MCLKKHEFQPKSTWNSGGFWEFLCIPPEFPGIPWESVEEWKVLSGLGTYAFYEFYVFQSSGVQWTGDLCILWILCVPVWWSPVESTRLWTYTSDCFCELWAWSRVHQTLDLTLLWICMTQSSGVQWSLVKNESIWTQHRSPTGLGGGGKSIVSRCELIAFPTLTMNSELPSLQEHSHTPTWLCHSHGASSPSIHKFLVDGNKDFTVQNLAESGQFWEFHRIRFGRGASQIRILFQWNAKWNWDIPGMQNEMTVPGIDQNGIRGD